MDPTADQRPTPHRAGKSVTPPYWQRQRSSSHTSAQSLGPGAITLVDHTEDASSQSGGLWAKSVTIDDYTIVSESRTGIGAYVVYNCTVETLDVGPFLIEWMTKADTPLRVVQ